MDLWVAFSDHTIVHPSSIPYTLGNQDQRNQVNHGKLIPLMLQKLRLSKETHN